MSEYQLPQAGYVSLKIYTILGQFVRTLIEGEKQAGFHRVIRDGRNDIGQRMQAGGFVQAKKAVLER